MGPLSPTPLDALAGWEWWVQASQFHSFLALETGAPLSRLLSKEQDVPLQVPA